MLFPYFELLASLFTLLFAFSIFNRHYENKLARFFGRFALIAFLASILEYSVRIAFTLELASLLNRFSGVFWCLLFPVYAHFCLIFAKKDELLENRFFLALLYLPSIVLSVLFLAGNIMFIRHEIYPFGIATQPSAFYWLYALLTIAYTLWGFVILISYSNTSKDNVEKSQALLIAYGATIPAVAGIMIDEVLPLLMGYRLFPPTCIFGLAIMSFVIFIAMQRYALFAISPSLAADIIVETMPDSMLVTDLEGRVLLLNDEAQKFFHVEKDKIVGMPIDELFMEKDKYYKLYDQIVYKNQEIERFPADLQNPRGEKIPSLINANKLRDALGASLGVVYVIRDIRG